MEAIDKLRIRKNYVFLVANLHVSNLIDYLYSVGTLTDDDLDELSNPTLTERNSARKILKILPYRGARAFHIFCECLRECAHKHVAEQLEQTEIDEADWETFRDHHGQPGVAEDPRIQDIQTQMRMQTELVLKFKSEIDGLNEKLKTREEESSLLHQRFEAIDKQVMQSGLRDQTEVLAYLKKYLRRAKDDYLMGELQAAGHSQLKAIAPKRKLERAEDEIDCAQQSTLVPRVSDRLRHAAIPFAPPRRFTSTTMAAQGRFTRGSHPRGIERVSSRDDPVEKTALVLGQDIVTYITHHEGQGTVPPSPARYEKCTSTLRRKVDELSKTHLRLFRKYVSHFAIDEINDYKTFNGVLNGMFSDGDSNWCRVVALYTFGSYYAKRDMESGMAVLAEFLGEFLGFYVTKNQGPWIKSEGGGWEGFLDFFPEGVETSAQTWSQLLDVHGVVASPCPSLERMA